MLGAKNQTVSTLMWIITNRRSNQDRHTCHQRRAINVFVLLGRYYSMEFRMFRIFVNKICLRPGVYVPGFTSCVSHSVVN